MDKNDNRRNGGEIKSGDYLGGKLETGERPLKKPAKSFKTRAGGQTGGGAEGEASEIDQALPSKIDQASGTPPETRNTSDPPLRKDTLEEQDWRKDERREWLHEPKDELEPDPLKEAVEQEWHASLDERERRGVVSEGGKTYQEGDGAGTGETTAAVDDDDAESASETPIEGEAPWTGAANDTKSLVDVKVCDLRRRNVAACPSA